LQNNGLVKFNVGEQPYELQLKNSGFVEIKMDGIRLSTGLTGKYLL
jgi:hypothetical protein